MTEATGYEAQTIHRLLELTGMPDEGERGSRCILTEMRKIRWMQM